MFTFLSLLRRSPAGVESGKRGTPARSKRPVLVSPPALEELEARLLPSTNYYVSPSGNDNNNGTSSSTPWQSINRVNQQVYVPGDSINFQAGGTFSGTLSFGPQDGGTASSPITVTTYGGGAPGRATIRPGTGAGILLRDTGGYTIQNLNLVGSGMATNQDYGVHIIDDLSSATTFSHMYFDNVAASQFGNYGFTFELQSSTSGYQDVRITNSQLYNNQYGGLIMFSPYFYNHAVTNEVVSGMYVGHVQVYGNPGATTSPLPSGNGIILGGVNGGLVERCECHDNGGPGARGNVGGVDAYNSDGVVIQYNEAYNIRTGTAVDGDGFDIDWDTHNCVLQYNYSHNNDGTGFLLIGNNALHLSVPPQTGATVRYNISENDARNNSYASIYVVGPVDSAEIYNNTIYLAPAPVGSPTAVNFYQWSGQSVHFRNNIFQITGGLTVVTTNGTQSGTDLLFQDNDYYTTGSSWNVYYDGVDYRSLSAWQAATGQEELNGRPVGFTVDPQLNRPGHGGTIGNADRLYTLTAYTLKSSSPLATAGLDLFALFGINPGTYDFYGHTLSEGAGFSLGADDIAGFTGGN